MSLYNDAKIQLFYEIKRVITKKNEQNGTKCLILVKKKGRRAVQEAAKLRFNRLRREILQI